MVAELTREGDLLQQSLLKGLRSHLDGADRERAVSRAGARRRREELRAIVGDEVAAVPVTLEDGRDLVDDTGVARLRGPDIPLEATDLGRMREIGRPDVRRRKPRAAMKEPYTHHVKP